MAKLSDDEVKAAVEAAFKPLRCVAEIWDYGQKIRFRVFDPDDQEFFADPRWPLDWLRNKKYLEGVLLEARAKVEKKGHRLEPWALC